MLITGATGFLGSHLARAFAGAGYEVRCLVRDPAATGALALTGVGELVPGDILEPRSLEQALAGVDAVVHSAGLVALRPRDRLRLLQVNVVGTGNVVQAAAARGLRVLHTSSIATIGATVRPQVRCESSPALPSQTGYGYEESKRAGEDRALQAAREGADVVVLNPGILLGPGDRRFSSTRFVRHYLRGELRFFLEGGTSLADVRTVASAYVAALEEGRPGERYILAGLNHSYQQLLQHLWELTGLFPARPFPAALARMAALWSQAAAALVPHPFEELNLPVIDYGRLYNYCSSAKAEHTFGYHPGALLPLLAETVRDHRQRGA